MKKLLLFFVASLTMLFVGCTQFDDSRLWDAIDELEDLYKGLDDRVEDLEVACEKMNTNIEALQTLVTALQNNDTITAITPIKQGDRVVGYTITFSKSEPITIYHGNDGKDGENGADGKDGADGYTPTIGVAQDEDGVYYWTLDGEWLLDENGNKIKAVGTDGKDGENGANGNDGANGEDGKDGENGQDVEDGITPQLEIRDGYWYISYDNGATWVELGKATGEDGKDGEDGTDGADGESLFQSVTWDDTAVIFTLTDGTKIVIPRIESTNIADINTSNRLYRVVDALVVATHKYGFIISDGTGEILVWLAQAHEYAVGDKVTIEGYAKQYRNIFEFASTTEMPLSITVNSSGTNFQRPYPTTMTGADLDEYINTIPLPGITYMTVTGTLSVSGSYYNIAVPGATTAVASILYYPNSEELTELNGKIITVVGYAVDIASNKYVNIMATKIIEQNGAIVVDGDLSDWDALDASKVSVATNTEGAQYDALKTLKVYADENNIYAYIEFDTDVCSEYESYVSGDKVNGLCLEFFINSDNGNDTGGYNDSNWSGGYFDYIIDGLINYDGYVSYDPGIFPWVGGVGESGWYWEERIPSNSGIGVGAVCDNGYELKIEHSLFTPLADTFTIGCSLVPIITWDLIGNLPNAADGLAEPLVVTVDK